MTPLETPKPTMWQEMKGFLFRGNVIDLAVAVIIGAAFTRIVTTLSEGIISPIIGIITGGIDLKTKYVVLSGTVPPPGETFEKTAAAFDAAIKNGSLNVLRYGQLINDIINFVIVGLILFFIVRWFSKYLAFMQAAAPPTATEVLLAEIRDELKNKPKV